MSDVAQGASYTTSIRGSDAPPIPSSVSTGGSNGSLVVHLVAQGKTSQYDHSDGLSACTSIALLSAHQLLLRVKRGPTLGLDSDPHSFQNQVVVDSVLVSAGIRIHNTISLPTTNAHFAVDEVWNVSSCARQGSNLAPCPTRGSSSHACSAPAGDTSCLLLECFLPFEAPLTHSRHCLTETAV